MFNAFSRNFNPYFGFKVIKFNDARQIKRHRQKRLNKKLNKKYGARTKGFLPSGNVMFDTINKIIYVPESQYNQFMMLLDKEICR